MTQEHKDLLLKDLCARLPYGTKLYCTANKMICIGPFTLSAINLDRFFNEDTKYVRFNKMKPYLFPLSSMTEEQRKEYDGIIYKNIELHCERYYDVIDIDDFDCLIDFYHKYHLDYRGLIPMGLAIDATDKNIY